MHLKESILNKINSYTDPFPHWELENPLSEDLIDELQNIKISDAPRAFDGTRAADAGGEDLDGKLRVFLEKDNSDLLPNGMELINDLRDKDIIDSIQEKIQKDLSDQKQINQLEEESIKVSIDNLFNFPFVKKAMEDNNLLIHGLIHDIGSGNLKCLSPVTENFENF